VGLGLAAGVLSSLALMRILRGLVAGLDSANPFRIAAAAFVAATAAAIACWVPTRRATIVYPVAVLREE